MSVPTVLIAVFCWCGNRLVIRVRRLGFLLVAVVLLVSGCVSEPPVYQPSGPVGPALDFSGFDPSDVMSDGVFYDFNSMSEDQIRQFIARVNSGCVPGEVPCLSQWVGQVPARAADRFCPGQVEGASQGDAAYLVFSSARACQVNPQVLLVLLQKEQSLLTASGGSLRQSSYNSATGFSCPDGSGCDQRFASFADQVYFAARQFQRYRLDSGSFKFRVGGTYNVDFAPNPQCGSRSVYMSNQATANLYNYTPYVPNDFALVGGRDDCAVPAQTLFYALFKAWFGPTH